MMLYAALRPSQFASHTSETDSTNHRLQFVISKGKRKKSFDFRITSFEKKKNSNTFFKMYNSIVKNVVWEASLFLVRWIRFYVVKKLSKSVARLYGGAPLRKKDWMKSTRSVIASINCIVGLCLCDSSYNTAE